MAFLIKILENKVPRTRWSKINYLQCGAYCFYQFQATKNNLRTGNISIIAWKGRMHTNVSASWKHCLPNILCPYRCNSEVFTGIFLWRVAPCPVQCGVFHNEWLSWMCTYSVYRVHLIYRVQTMFTTTFKYPQQFRT